METITPPKQVFMAKFQRFEPASRDSTAIMAAKTCLRLFFYTIVLGFREKEKDKPVYFRFGSAYHKHKEVLYQTGDFKLSIEAASKVWNNYTPNPDDRFAFMTGPRLLESMMKSYEVYQKEKEQNRIEVVAVEQSFEVVMKDETTRRGGKADQFIKWNGKLWGRDWKTSSKTSKFYDQTIDPNDQFTGYIWGLSRLSGQLVQGLIVDVLFNSKTQGPEIKQFTSARTPQQLDRWEDEQIHFEKIISISREADIWPQQEKSCSFCKFRSVCTKSSEAAMMNQLESNFVQKPWDYKTLGEGED